MQKQAIYYGLIEIKQELKEGLDLLLIKIIIMLTFLIGFGEIRENYPEELKEILNPL